jgi:RsiW-degrading membrane proteinase PrsW (M82 family)
MMDIINFIALSGIFNVLFFWYASTKMKSKPDPVKTVIVSFLFSIPLSFLLIGVYTTMLIYAAKNGTNEDAMWEYMEQEEVQ